MSHPEFSLVLSIDLKKRNEGVGGKLRGEWIYGYIEMIHIIVQQRIM